MDFSGIYPSEYVLAYTATKHGVVGFSRSLAVSIFTKLKI